MPPSHPFHPSIRARCVLALSLACLASAGMLASPTPAWAAPAADVTAALSSRRVPAESCVKVSTTVTPNKAGQLVRFQRSRGGAWNTWAEVVLGPMSRASATLCFAWSDLGRVDLRVVWPAQDADNDTGVSETKTVFVGRAGWMQRIDHLLGRKAFSVSAAIDGTALYRHRDTVRRAPASNEKLLLSMAILDRLGPDERMPMRAAVTGAGGGVVRRNLWIMGGGDPEVGRGRIKTLARRIKQAGVRRIRGRVLGSKGFFGRDWFAKGWKSYFPAQEVAFPTALTFEGNTARGRHIRDPERRAAAALTSQLESIGVRVRGKPGDGRPPRNLSTLASVDSRPLAEVLRAQNVNSRNFYAEVLGKLLGARRYGAPGTIRKGARAIESWARAHGARIRAFDGSGLSYANRVSPAGMVRLLAFADGQTWADELRSALPTGGQGTLKGRLGAVRVRAKTGTLTQISALSGWVWLRSRDAWAEFSILSKGTSKTAAVRIEDKIVRLLAKAAG